jgi:hypothetical protein
LGHGARFSVTVAGSSVIGAPQWPHVTGPNWEVNGNSSG